MKRSELKEMIREELRIFKSQRLKEQLEQKPVVDTEKADGIILGAVKTLFNSGAIVGVDPSRISDVARELIKHIEVAVSPYGKQQEPTDDGLNDDETYDKESDTLDDQNQYDPDISKQTQNPEEKPKEKPEEPLFEIKKIARKLKI